MGKTVYSMWARYMSMAAALCLFDGGLWSLLFSYPSLPQFKALPLYKPISIPGATAMMFALMTLAIEKPLFPVPMALKSILYLMIAAFSAMQFSCIVGAEFYIISGITYMIAVMSGETGDISEDRKLKQQDNRGKA
ncbi:hypothetical protein H9P43_001747 [Blastocladiella emersonii ATCC 22665]|nr:hypothetical protein H9P43_001747 [Blastocladiella emersonii ATCC 22665]